ncbi:MAG: hypothetical protein N838_32480 [Thiohalocapsa sp. PB-PSB1]|nr:MAG: hypothetical protein N838_32480 [Thiohalocapsa sp. PB-PSB1]
MVCFSPAIVQALDNLMQQADHILRLSRRLLHMQIRILIRFGRGRPETCLSSIATPQKLASSKTVRQTFHAVSHAIFSPLGILPN